MNGAYVDGSVVAARIGECWLSVRSHHPDGQVVMVHVLTPNHQGTWAVGAGTHAAFAGRLVKHEGRLVLEATTAWIEGSEVTTYNNEASNQ